MRPAFTLVELLIVIAIMLLLAGMILVGASLLKDSAEVMITKQRMQDVRKGLLERATLDDGFMSQVQEAMVGNKLDFKPLRVVLNELINEHGLQLGAAGEFDRLPPGLASIYDDVGCYAPSFYASKFKWYRMLSDAHEGLVEGTFQRRPATLDNVILFENLCDFVGDIGFYDDGVDVGDAIGTVQYYHDYQLDRDNRTFFWWRRDRRGVIEDGGKIRYAWIWGRTSPTDERLDTTLEVMPGTKELTDWYLGQWPLLTELKDGNGIVQRAWPDSDWDQATPGAVAPVWEAPFGHAILQRSTGELAEDQYLVREAGGAARVLSDFSPLYTVTFLKMAGVMAASDADEEYRNNRNRELPFNDRWGNPLVIGSGLFVAPRYGLDPAPADEASHGLDKEYSKDLRGGRDWYWKQCQAVYGYSRALYASVGAMAERRLVSGVDNPVDSEVDTWAGTGGLSWESDKDSYVLRAAWLQVTEECGADAFDDAAMLDSPWSDEVTKAKKGGKIVGLLSAPVEIR